MKVLIICRILLSGKLRSVRQWSKVFARSMSAEEPKRGLLLIILSGERTVIELNQGKCSDDDLKPSASLAMNQRMSVPSSSQANRLFSLVFTPFWFGRDRGRAEPRAALLAPFESFSRVQCPLARFLSLHLDRRAVGRRAEKRRFALDSRTSQLIAVCPFKSEK